MSRREDVQVLVVGVPLRHLESAVALAVDAVVLPAGGPGDLDRTPSAAPVRLIALDAGDAEVPAATWGATFVARVAHEPGDPWPERIPPTWGAEHPPPPAPGSEATRVRDDEDEDLDDEDAVGPQAFFEVTELTRLPRSEWIFANELVAKQRRGGRTFVPRTPRLVVVID
jgi:hypothetical protein